MINSEIAKMAIRITGILYSIAGLVLTLSNDIKCIRLSWLVILTIGIVGIVFNTIKIIRR